MLQNTLQIPCLAGYLTWRAVRSRLQPPPASLPCPALRLTGGQKARNSAHSGMESAPRERTPNEERTRFRALFSGRRFRGTGFGQARFANPNAARCRFHRMGNSPSLANFLLSACVAHVPLLRCSISGLHNKRTYYMCTVHDYDSLPAERYCAALAARL
jgi:hypothetical protein